MHKVTNRLRKPNAYWQACFFCWHQKDGGKKFYITRICFHKMRMLCLKGKKLLIQNFSYWVFFVLFFLNRFNAITKIAYQRQLLFSIFQKNCVLKIIYDKKLDIKFYQFTINEWKIILQENIKGNSERRSHVPFAVVENAVGWKGLFMCGVDWFFTPLNYSISVSLFVKGLIWLSRIPLESALYIFSRISENREHSALFQTLSLSFMIIL